MDESKARKLVNKYIKGIRNGLQLWQWEINITYMHQEDALAELKIDAEYKKANIRINHDDHETEADLLRTLFHELLHIMHADFELYRDQVWETVSKRQAEVLDKSYTYACEKTVGRLLAIFEHGLGYDIKQFVKRTNYVNDKRLS